MYILDRLWRGGFSPADRFLNPDGEYKKTVSRLCREMEGFTEMLSPEAKEKLEALRPIYDDMTEIKDADTFIEGVRFGARVMLDVLGDYQGQFTAMFPNE